MAYAQNNIREDWDSLNKPELFEFSCNTYDSLMYIPYMAKTIIARDVTVQGQLKVLKQQYPIGVLDGTTYSGTKGVSIDIDATYICNLACPNCNRASHLPKLTRGTNKDMAFINNFIEQYKHYGKTAIVKLTGGEPMLNPLLPQMMEALNEHFTVWVFTNGILGYNFPDYVYVENSEKIRDVAPMFHTTYMAPIDDERFKDVTDIQYSKGCDVLACGYGYDETGIHPCTNGMALSRLLKNVSGFKTREECDLHRNEYLTNMCKLCGLFKKMGAHNVDKAQFDRTDVNQYSNSWKFLEEV
jgi:hypothetical protein